MKEFHWTLVRLLVGALVIIPSSTGSYINAPCSTQTDCGALLECLEGFCQCDSLNEIYDASTNQCLLLVGRECGDDGRKCVPHADCSRSMCRCKPGYRMSADFLCKPDFGSPCRKSQQDDDCDETQGLICVQGTCHCFNSTWTFQGQFGCVDPNSQQFNEMMSLLNQTQVLLKENGLEIRDVFNDLGLQNDPSSEAIFGNMLAEARQFQHDTYNTNDLQFAAQNQSPQQSGGGGGGGSGFNIGQLLNTFQTLSNLFGGRNNNNNNQGGGGGGGGGGGFFRNLFGGGGGGGNQGGGYSESGSGYQASGQPEMNQGQRFNLINSFLNLFNQLIPIVRQLRMRFSPVRFFQNLLNRFAPSSSTTTTAAPAAAIQQGPPTVIQHNGNFNSNPIFDGQQSSGGGGEQNNQGQGTFRFFMRTRERFRNALRGGGASAGGYDYTPAKPPGKYGPPPANNYGPPESTPAEGAEPAGASQQGFYVNQQQQQQHQAQAQHHGTTSNYNTLPVSHSPVTQGQGQQHSPAPAPAPAQRQLQQQNFGGLPSPSTFNSGQHPNHQSFFSQPTQTQSSQAPNQQQYKTHDNANFDNNNNNHQQQQQQPQQQNYNAAATSHQQTTFVPHPQPNHVHHQPQNHHNNVQYIYNNRRPESGSETTNLNVVYPSSPPPIPQFKLQIQSSHHTPAAPTTKENISQNFILSEADDPHPGFTPHSSQSPPSSSENTHQGSYRTAARFERIGHEEEPTTVVSNTAAQNWRDSF